MKKLNIPQQENGTYQQSKIITAFDFAWRVLFKWLDRWISNPKAAKFKSCPLATNGWIFLVVLNSKTPLRFVNNQLGHS